jgi:murein DD-endopeptidase MepM/ murein hydrolase activator NlpD
MNKPKLSVLHFFSQLREFVVFLYSYFRNRGYAWFGAFETSKNALVDLLYKKRGKYARPFLHFGTISLTFFVITFGPLILAQSEDEERVEMAGGILNTVSAYNTNFYTLQAEEVRQYRGGEIIVHVVTAGETLSSIASRYGLQVNTILWENNLTESSKLKPGQELRILPIDGVRHKVARGETIYSVGKKYGLEGSEIQVIVDYPFNEFLNDETFELATGQYLMVPDGVKQDLTATAKKRIARRQVQITADAGAVTATGSFVWPASGRVTQGYRFYHKAVDIANRSGGPILAADGGTVLSAGWLDGYGYGNRVIIDHGNGYITLYAHLSVVQVRNGQRVNRGDVIGQMGSTGRSTGTHVHFEIRSGGVLLNPLSFLQ